MRRAAFLLVFACSCRTTGAAADLIAEGPTHQLRDRDANDPQSSEEHAHKLLLILFDGIDRHTLYDLLRNGKMPALAALLGGNGSRDFDHAELDERMLAAMPSSTMAAWTTTMTGLAPSEHGVTGNEFFIRESLKLGAPAPVTFNDASCTIDIFTHDYLDKLRVGRSVYERMRERDPNINIWVTMHFVYAGADKLMVTKRTIFANAFEHFVAEAVDKLEHKEDLRAPYATLDRQAIGVTRNALDDQPLPDVLTVYLSGTDLYAHIAEEGPDEARVAYLTQVVEPALAKLGATLAEHNALDDRFVVVTADHGHTEVAKKNALTAAHGPATLMQQVGYRVRPFKKDVSDDTVFDSVWVAGGATGYIYLADRSTCVTGKQICNWRDPPRYTEDVLPLAEALYRANATGALMPALKGTLDFILTREPKAYGEIDNPFEVYIGDGKTQELDAYLAEHPHPTYVAFSERLRDLAVGTRGERAGDIMLIAHNGDRDTPEERYYFAEPYHSWHGSPSKRDSEIPLIVAHPTMPRAAIKALLDKHLSQRPYPERFAELLMDLRYSD